MPPLSVGTEGTRLGQTNPGTPVGCSVKEYRNALKNTHRYVSESFQGIG
jgi:hypothetical protein